MQFWVDFDDDDDDDDDGKEEDGNMGMIRP